MKRKTLRWGRRGAVVALALVAAIVVWGLVEPRLILDVREVEASIPGLPSDWEDAEVAVLADFQLGMWLDNESMVRRAFAEAVAREPDLVLLAGDFIYGGEDDPVPKILAILEQLRPLHDAKVPVVAVLGNHDWGLEWETGDADPFRAALVSEALEANGVHVLENGAAPVTRPGDGAPLWVVGLGSHWADRDDVSAALEGVPRDAPRLVLMHHPDSFEALPARAAPLAVAGHTHGGQARIPFLPDWSWLTFVKDEAVHADGWAPEDYGAPGNRLYVNRGIGFSRLPVRLNCPPELTIVRLRRAPPVVAAAAEGRADSGSERIDVAGADPIWPILPERLEEDGIEEVEERLASLGYLAEADERWTTASAGALRRFQREHGLGATGALDFATIRALGVEADELELE